MKAGVPVTKMHGTLNDFLIIDERERSAIDVREFALRYCDRRAGIGADGLLVIETSAVADAKMRIINSDGTEAETCGNGLRCVARYLNENREGHEFTIETLAGVSAARILASEPEYSVRVSMGVPVLEERPLPFRNAAFVSTGNPHVVIFADSLAQIDLESAANRLAGWPGFESGSNVHAVVARANSLLVRHWERGVGLTQACGSGAVACAAAAQARGLATLPADVQVPGGSLRVEWDGRGPSFLTGPAERVCDARVEASFARR